jgi:hypothetical protein
MEGAHLADVNILDLPGDAQPVRFRADTGPRFIITVDAEEEFDWGAPLERDRHSLITVPILRKFQQFCEGLDVVPIYLLDYPVATSPDAAEALREPVAAGKAEVGVQLHPWVNPPFEEDITEHNSFAGNLPEPLERAKFTLLRDSIEKNFGAAPLIYRAGRYGVGPNTVKILRDLGLRIDTSVRARFDYSHAGGPNYRNHPHMPYWLDRDAGLLELPLTTVYWGMLRQLGGLLYPYMWRAPSMRGVLARLGLLERIPLTPEGVTAEEAIRGIDIAIDEGLPLLVLSFHSPSLAPGHTPYVQTERDLDAFYDWWRAVLGHLRKRGVAPSSVSDILASIDDNA